jgi:uncharacterized damage-inducible protein DinB
VDELARAQRMFEFDVWANTRVNESLRSAAHGVEKDGASSQAPSLIKALQIWAHVQWARQMWLSRLGAAEPPSMDEGRFPVRSLARVLEECAEMDRAGGEYMARLTPQELARPVRYTSTEGIAYESTVADILAHAVNHSSYHRGQIARLVAECGGEVAVTDFIAFTRKRV